MAKRGRSGEKEAFWRAAIDRQATSGLSVRAFCRAQSLSEPSFYAWRRALAERDVTAVATRAASSNACATSGPSFLPVSVVPPIAQTSIVLELIGGHVLKLPSSTPISQLVELILALDHRGEA